MVSSAEGKLAAGKTPYDLMRATSASTAGARDVYGGHGERRWIRDMQLIADLEGTMRGPYGGCVGYFSFNGNLDTCITIRTALCFSPRPSPGLRPPSPAPACEGHSASRRRLGERFRKPKRNFRKR